MAASIAEVTSLEPMNRLQKHVYSPLFFLNNIKEQGCPPKWVQSDKKKLPLKMRRCVSKVKVIWYMCTSLWNPGSKSNREIDNEHQSLISTINFTMISIFDRVLLKSVYNISMLHFQKMSFNLPYEGWFYVESSKSPKHDFSWVFTAWVKWWACRLHMK